MNPQRTSPLFSQVQERNSASSLCFTPVIDSVDLEDDEDIRILLDRIRAESLRRPATNGGKPSGKTRPASSRPCGRSSARVYPPPTKGGSSAERFEGFVKRPKSAGANGWESSLLEKKTNPSDVVQLRRKMLIRSHGEGRNVHLFPTEPFETTAMGRKACYIDPERRTEVPSACCMISKP